MRDRRAVAVVLADGETIGAPRGVLADVGAPALYRDLVGEEHLPAQVVADLERFQYDPATFKVDWALSGPIPWRTEAGDARRAPCTCATAWTASPRSRPTSRRTGSRRARSCSSAR